MNESLLDSGVLVVWKVFVRGVHIVKLKVDCELSIVAAGACENESIVVEVVSVDVWDIGAELVDA